MLLSVPQQEERRPLLDEIDPELRKKISRNLLGDPETLTIQEEIGKGKAHFVKEHNPMTFCLKISFSRDGQKVITRCKHFVFNKYIQL